MFMKLKKYEIVIEREKIKTDKAEEWTQSDLKAVNIIYSAISDKQFEFVSEEETAYKIIKKLDSMYLKESTSLQIVCRNRLEKLRLRNYSDFEAFFSDFEKAVNELKGAGAKISKKEIFNYMLNTLPESYSYIGDLIETLKNEDQTVGYVRNKIKIAEMKCQKEYGKKGQMYLPQEREAATSAKKLGILHENAKLAAKRDAAAEHGEAQHVAAVEAEPEEATTAEGEEISMDNKEPAGANRAVKVRAHGQRRHTLLTPTKQTDHVLAK